MTFNSPSKMWVRVSLSKRALSIVMILAQFIRDLPGRSGDEIDEAPVAFVLVEVRQPLGADGHQAEARGAVGPQDHMEPLDVVEPANIPFRFVLSPHLGAIQEIDIAAFDDLGRLAGPFLSHDA